MPPPVSRAAILHQLPSWLEERGVPADPVFREGGFRASDTVTGAIVHRSQVCAVLARAARVLGDPMLGLALGLRSQPARLGRAGAALAHGPTIRDRLRAHTAQMPALQTHVRLQVRVEGREAVWRHALVETRQEGVGLLYEGASAFTLQVLRAWLGSDWSPSGVSFPHTCQGRPEAYGTIFGSRVRFGTGGAAEIRFDRELLERPVQAGAPSSAGPEPPGAALRDLDTFSLRHHELHRALEDMIGARLGHEPVTIAACAATLGLSTRTLQRRLDEDGITFGDLLDGTRRGRALSSLREATGNLTGLAMALGYSDAAHFVRAFKRWTGVTPSAFRGGVGSCEMTQVGTLAYAGDWSEKQ